MRKWRAVYSVLVLLLLVGICGASTLDRGASYSTVSGVPGICYEQSSTLFDCNGNSITAAEEQTLTNNLKAGRIVFWRKNANGSISSEDGNPAVSTYARVTGSNVTTSSTSLADITGLSVALAANSIYEFEACLSVASSSSAGNKYGVNFSAAGATVEGQESGMNAATGMRTARISALNTAGSVMPVAAADAAVRLHGIVSTGDNAGNLTVQHLKVTSGTATVYVNSFLKVTRIQ